MDNSSAHTTLLVVGLLAMLAVSVAALDRTRLVAPSDHTLASAAAARESRSKDHHYPVIVRQPAEAPRVDLGVTDTSGNSVTAACVTCHAPGTPNQQNRIASDLKEFHQGLSFAHGQVSCLSCHNANDYDSLRLADGTSIAYSDVMTLCAQCHGPQTRDYKHGAHGGMTGHWDLSRGPRERNNCVDCHDPHAPAFPKMNPTFKPRDRFLNDGKH